MLNIKPSKYQHVSIAITMMCYHADISILAESTGVLKYSDTLSLVHVLLTYVLS